jgi:excisionase family DNA binding protein
VAEKTKEYLSITEVARETSLSESFWRKAMFQRRIPYLKAGRRVMIRRCDLRAWVSANVVPATRNGEIGQAV